MPDTPDTPDDAAPADARERAQLCDLMLELGPDAPTLCEGWATLDLAAHLVVRERQPLRGGLAILGGDRFAGLESRLLAGAKERGFEALVERMRSGPPLAWRIPGLRKAANLIEWFVHHEDVRRPNGHPPRADAAELDRELWSVVRPASRFTLRRVKGAKVGLSAPGYGEVTARGNGPAAVLTGRPQELVLYLNGRKAVADVEITGDPEAVKALTDANLGI